MKTTKTLFIMSLVLVSFLSVKAQGNYKPRKLTVPEAKNNPSVELKHLISSSDKRLKQIDSSSEEVGPLSHLPKGTNQEPGPKDAIRYNTSA